MNAHTTEAGCNATKAANLQAAQQLRDVLARRFPAYVWEVMPKGSREFHVRARSIRVSVFCAFNGKTTATVEDARGVFARVSNPDPAEAVTTARAKAATALQSLLAAVQS
jgi:oxalate decarboxylase/phosphoglucose isomerase-like protein (cupin superfamily)